MTTPDADQQHHLILNVVAGKTFRYLVVVQSSVVSPLACVITQGDIGFSPLPIPRQQILF